MIFLFLALVAILFSGANLYVNFGRGHHQKHLCGIILNRNRCLRIEDISIFSSDGDLFNTAEEPFVNFLKKAS